MTEWLTYIEKLEEAGSRTEEVARVEMSKLYGKSIGIVQSCGGS